MKAIDTNVVVRAIVNDDRQQVERVKALLDTSDVYIPTTVLLETEWVLRGLYGLGRKTLADSLEKFCGLDCVSVAEPDKLERALSAYRDGADFADVVHVLQCELVEVASFVTFDASLRKRLRRFSYTVTLGEL